MITTLLPLLSVLVISILHYLFKWIGLMNYGGIGTLFWAVSFFGFGLTLTTKPKRSQGWVLKLIIAFILFVLFSYQLGWINIPMISNSINNLYIYLIYVWCGWAFFRN